MRNLRDLTGQIFGDYKVIGFDDTRGKYKYYWKCECINCGTPKSIAYSSLSRQLGMRCEVCNQKFGFVRNPKGFYEDLSGQKFGFLTVDSFAYNNWDHSHWNCTCRCGNHIIKSIGFLHNGINRMCDECIEKYKDINNVLNSNNLDNNGVPIMVYIQNKVTNEYMIDGDFGIINTNIIVDKDIIPIIQKLNRRVRINNHGYAYISYGSHDILLSRIILHLPFGEDDTDLDIAEHKNGNRLDNTKGNLRICEKHINPINCKMYSNNTSGHKGISWLERLQKWQVNLQIDKKNLYLGVYNNLGEAIRVRDAAEEKYFGEYNRKKEDLYNGYNATK